MDFAATKEHSQESSVGAFVSTPSKGATLAEPAPAPVAATPAGANASAAAGVFGHYADGEGSLNEKATAKAVAWAQHQHFSKDKLVALQNAVGAPITGEYNAATAEAVAQTQRLHGLHADGQAGHKTQQALGLEGEAAAKSPAQGQTKTPTHGQAKGQAAHQAPIDGVSVALFNQFNTKKTGKGDLEFERRADGYAKQYQAAGLRDGALVWNKSTPFQELSGLTSAIQGIHAALVENAHESEPASSAKSAAPGIAATETSETADKHDVPETTATSAPASDQAQDKAEPDRSTQIKHLAIFTHGMEHGIDTNPNKHVYGDGLHKDMSRKNPSNIAAFVTNVGGALTPDVSVQLYACSTGREEGQGKEAELEAPAEGERRGGDSFASHLAEELGEQGNKEASVYAHINAKHTTENPYARVFGYEAGAEGGGKALFEVLYSAEFADGELLKLVPDYFTRPTEEQAQLHSRMRAAMWEHYIDSIFAEHHRRDHKGTMAFGRKTYMGMGTFQDPEGSAMKLQADFQSRWLTKERQRAILGDASPKKQRDQAL